MGTHHLIKNAALSFPSSKPLCNFACWQLEQNILISETEVHEKHAFLFVILTLLSEWLYANIDMNFNTDLSSILKYKHEYMKDLERKGSLRIK